MFYYSAVYSVQHIIQMCHYCSSCCHCY